MIPTALLRFLNLYGVVLRVCGERKRTEACVLLDILCIYYIFVLRLGDVKTFYSPAFFSLLTLFGAVRASQPYLTIASSNFPTFEQPTRSVKIDIRVGF